MEQVYGSMNGDQETFFSKAPGCVPVTCKDYLILSHKGFNYYIIDLRTTDINRIWNIVKACEAVENECWKAQENFFDYIQKCDVLSYAEKDGRVIAFDAVTLLFSGTTCLYSNDETMVLKAFRGKNIARKLVMATGEWFFTKTSMMQDIKHLVFVSISANPRVVNGYFKNSYTRILFDCSFNPSPQLIALKDEYCRKHSIELVDEKYPFCMKNLFPGSNTFDCTDKRFQFSPKVTANMPTNFDHMARGDAFAFMVKVPIAAARAIIMILMATDFGKSYFSRKGVGFFSKHHDIIPIYTEAWATKAAEPEASIAVVPTQEDTQTVSAGTFNNG